MATARDEAIGIVEYYQGKGYDVRRVVQNTEDGTREFWDIYSGETRKGRITYHREDRGPQVTWHNS